MKKKIFTLLLTLVLVCGFSMSAMAASTSETVQTSGGSKGHVAVTFRCTCIQDTIPVNFSWTSSMSPPSGITGWRYQQNGAITLSNHTQKTFSVSQGTYSYVVRDALVGGNSSMKASCSGYGSASKMLSVTR